MRARSHAQIASLVWVFLVGACGESGQNGAAPPSRVIAVSATETDEATAEDFCELTFAQGDTPFAYPELEAGDAPPASGSRWINIWATWCAPCIEELPRIREFQRRLEADGSAADLVLINADAERDAYAEFNSSHPETRGSVRFSDPAALPDWAESLGLSRNLTLPVHLLVDESGHLRCLRASGVSDGEYEALKAALSQ